LATSRALLTRQDGRVVCEQLLVAARPLRRMRGLLGRASLPRGEGILLRPAGSVHTFFMRFPIDVVFLDDDLRVLDVAADVPPWRVARRSGARSVLEVSAGEARRREMRPGDRLVIA
jgi:uncharacterized protein